jgi:hypothetical protein
MLAYVTLATELLEPGEAARLVEAVALDERGLDGDVLEAAARGAGLVLRSVERLGSEWRERMLEDETWDPAQTLLRLSRLRRRRDELAKRHGAAAVAAEEGNLVWGVYQLLGKLCPTVYVWERRA